MSKLIDMTGQKFGKLTVVGPHKKIIGKFTRDKTFWNCLCTCGNFTWQLRDSLITGRTVNCITCTKIRRVTNMKSLHEEGKNFKLPYGLASFNKLLGRYKRVAKNRGHNFNLTREEFKKLTSSSCHYCNRPPHMKTEERESNGEYKYNGIDRKDNNIGYELYNCVSCCKTCNKAKLTMGYEEFILWIKSVYTELRNKGKI